MLRVKFYKKFELLQFIYPYPRSWTKVPLVLFCLSLHGLVLSVSWKAQFACGLFRSPTSMIFSGKVLKNSTVSISSSLV